MREKPEAKQKNHNYAAKLAALPNVFENGLGQINAGAIKAASCVALWHLNESRRFFGEMALTEDLANAANLEMWLIEYCRRERAEVALH